MSQPLESRVAYVREEGEPYEVEQAYREHQNWLIAFLRRRFGQQDAEDLAQETYTRAVFAKATIRNPRAFLARVALNAARDLLRRRSVRPQLTREDAAPPPAMAGAQEEALLLKQIILALPPKLQEVFVLSRFAGLTYRRGAQLQRIGELGDGEVRPRPELARPKPLAKSVHGELKRFDPTSRHSRRSPTPVTQAPSGEAVTGISTRIYSRSTGVRTPSIEAPEH